MNDDKEENQYYTYKHHQQMLDNSMKKFVTFAILAIIFGALSLSVLIYCIVKVFI